MKIDQKQLEIAKRMAAEADKKDAENVKRMSEIHNRPKMRAIWGASSGDKKA